MRLYEIAMTDAPYFKGMPASQEVVPPNAFEIRTDELRDNIKGWEKIYDKLPDKSAPYAQQVQFRIDNMKQELKDFEEIGAEEPAQVEATADCTGGMCVQMNSCFKS